MAELVTDDSLFSFPSQTWPLEATERAERPLTSPTPKFLWHIHIPSWEDQFLRQRRFKLWHRGIPTGVERKGPILIWFPKDQNLRPETAEPATGPLQAVKQGQPVECIYSHTTTQTRWQDSTAPLQQLGKMCVQLPPPDLGFPWDISSLHFQVVHVWELNQHPPVLGPSTRGSRAAGQGWQVSPVQNWWLLPLCLEEAMSLAVSSQHKEVLRTAKVKI